MAEAERIEDFSKKSDEIERQQLRDIYTIYTIHVQKMAEGRYELRYRRNVCV